MKKRWKIIIAIIIIFLLIAGYVWCTTYPLANGNFDKNATGKKEKEYVKAYCKGTTEYVLPDRTRVDCLTDEYAIEFDWGYKWAESIGQALYYAEMTDKKPAVAIILKNPKDKRFIERIKKAKPDLTIFEIKAKNYNEQNFYNINSKHK